MQRVVIAVRIQSSMNDDAAETALRVLSAVIRNQFPDQRDVAELRLSAPSFPERPLDELACDVIHKWLGETRKREAHL
jgi:hypothetical protein